MTANGNLRLVPGGASEHLEQPTEGDAHARALLLFEQELDLVGIVAGQLGRTLGSLVPRDELLEAGREGLFDAARRFDPSRGVPFRAYANRRVKGAIFDYVRSSCRLPRKAYERLKSAAVMTDVSAGEAEFVFSGGTEAQAPDVEDQFGEHLDSLTSSFVATVASPESAAPATGDEIDKVSPEEAAIRAETRERLRAGIATLEVDEAGLIQLYYFEENSIRQTAKILGVSKTWAQRLHSRALTRLAKHLLGTGGSAQ
ncbi:MAG: sigma-70 family RNA polymerase sigma factor [Polyangiaceae bacterium]